jgi:chorismate binding enzyme
LCFSVGFFGSVPGGCEWQIEVYPTVYQMVSQVSARVPDKSLYRTLEALFPCGSVTGAPKLRAMEIINRLERSSRGIYTGSIGHIRPGGDFNFNVAIRTIELAFDGEDCGNMPNSLLLSPGRHKVFLQAPDAPDKTREVEIKVGYRTSVRINFAAGSPETKIEPETAPRRVPVPRLRPKIFGR